MGFEENKIRQPKQNTKSFSNKKIERSLINILGGTFLSRESAFKWLPFIFFLAFLAVLYITNIYISEKKKRKIEDVHSEIKELRYEAISTKSKLMYLSNPSQVAKKLAEKGIKESRVPPKKLIIKKEEK